MDDDAFEEFSVGNMAPVVPLTGDLEEEEEILSDTEKVVQERFNALDFGKEEETFTEAVGELIIPAIVGVVIGTIVGNCTVAVASIHWIRKALKEYEKNHSDLIPINKLTKRMFKTNSFEETPDMNDEVKNKLKKILKRLGKGKIVYIYFDGDNPICGVCVDRENTSSTRRTRMTSLEYPGIGKKYIKYYFCAMCYKYGMLCEDSVKWAREYLASVKDGKPFEEELIDIPDPTDNIFFESMDWDVYLEKDDGIDDDILPIVQKLNSKGYKVKYSCSGHPSSRSKNDVYRDGVYKGNLYSSARVIFDKKYNIGHAPKYWQTKSLKDGNASAIYVEPPTFKIVDGLPTEAFNKWKAKYMASLKSWVDALPQEGTKKKDDTKEVVETVMNELLLDTM